MSMLATRIDDREDRGADESAKLVRLPLAPTATEQCVLVVGLRSRDGRWWSAIGGGATVADAIAWALDSCPDDTTWYAVGWRDLYGE